MVRLSEHDLVEVCSVSEVHLGHRAARADGVGHECCGHPSDRCFASAVDVGDDHAVCTCKARTEGLADGRGPRVAVRLEHHHEALVATSACRGDRGGNLTRQVGVVVDEGHPIDGASMLESSGHAAEAPKPIDDRGIGNPSRSGCGGDAPASCRA